MMKLSAFKDREITIERVKDELMDENMALIESTNRLRTRVAELLGSRFHAGSDEDNAKVNEELREELRKGQHGDQSSSRSCRKQSEAH